VRSRTAYLDRLEMSPVEMRPQVILGELELHVALGIGIQGGPFGFGWEHR
jgi:hypothetical protein